MAKSEGLLQPSARALALGNDLVYIQGQNMGFFLLKQSGIKFQVEG